MTSYGWDGGPNRQGDWLQLSQPPITDAAGHVGSILYLDEFYGALYEDGVLLTDGDDPNRLNQSVQSGRHRYRVVQNYWRNNPFWQRSTRVDTEWGFTSQTTPDGGHESIPMMSVTYDLALSEMNTAPRDRSFTFDVGLGMPQFVPAVPLARRSIEVSTDRGVTWHRADVNRCSVTRTPSAGAVTHCGVRVHNPKRGTVSLRVGATDVAGRTVTQTVLDAYAVS
jgi:hypothetical protein